MGAGVMTAAPFASHAGGFAREAGESANPELWTMLRGAWLPLVGPTGARLHDEGGRRIDGAHVNGPVWVATDRGWAVETDGASSYVTADHPANIDAWSPLTVVLFLNVLVAQPTATRKMGGLGATSGGSPKVEFRQSSAAPYRFFVRFHDRNSATYTAGAGGWRQLAAIEDSPVSRRFLVDARPVGTDTTSVDDSSYGVGRVRIGARVNATPASYVQARFGYLLWWNRVLTIRELRMLLADPYALVRPRRRAIVSVPVSGGGLSMPVAMGTYRNRRVA